MPKTPREKPVPVAVNPPKKDRSAPNAGHAAHEDTSNHAAGKVAPIDSELTGQRKLIRPVMPENTPGLRDPRRRGFRGILTRRGTGRPPAAVADSSQAEGFYLQKQIQTQTQMVFVLEGGEQVEGTIEWYDRNCIKVRNNSRVLIYKSSIKYLFKASDRQFESPMTLV